MPVYQQKYRIQFLTVEIGGVSEEVTVEITDTGTTSSSPLALIYLEGTADPVRLSTVNNDRTPFQAIIARNATISFLSSADYNSTTFSVGTDNRFRVQIFTASDTLFDGFLLQDEIEERFVNPAVAKNEVRLVATDNIGTLKEQELKDSAGDTLTDGHYSLLYYIQSCLARTGLSLPINISWNIWEEHFDISKSALEQAYLYSLTFEKEVETKEDCYTVLDKIVKGLKARLFQWGGGWWLVRIHELRTSLDTISRVTYTAAGTLSGTYEDVTITATVEHDTGLFLAYANAVTTVQRQHKLDKATYRYETPKEVPRNRDFTRGTWVSLLDPYLPLETYATFSAFPTTGRSEMFYKAADTGLYYNWASQIYIPVTGRDFTISNWTTGCLSAPVSVTPYIHRTYNERGDEAARKVVIPAGTYSPHYIISEPIPVHFRDKFIFGVDWKLNVDLTVGGSLATYYVPVAQIVLRGDNGTDWIYASSEDSGLDDWYVGDATNLSAAYIGHQVIDGSWQPSQTDELQNWMNVSAEIKPAPADGDLYIVLLGFLHQRYGYRDIHFSNLRFEYIPLIAGSYQKYAGQSDKVEQAALYKAKNESDTNISDSPKKIFKGALKRYNGTSYVLAGDWEDGLTGGMSDATRYGNLVVYDEWNQVRKERVFINGATVKGFAPKYSFLNSKLIFADFSDTKRFLCLQEDYSVKKLEGRCDFIEVFDTGETNDYTTPHEFKYEQ